jgi:prepilin-type N-terminal cleavage/methylation domain-containing protein
MRAPCVVRRTSGVTLLEMLVVLTVLGLVLGVTGLAIESLRTPRESAQVLDLKRARANAVHSGVPRTAHGIRFLPDGRAIGPGVNALTGEPLAK